jgi:hypothetical protein
MIYTFLLSSDGLRQNFDLEHQLMLAAGSDLERRVATLEYQVRWSQEESDRASSLRTGLLIGLALATTVALIIWTW